MILCVMTTSEITLNCYFYLTSTSICRLFVRGLTILAYLFYFKRRGINIMQRFRSVMSCGDPDRTLLINATTEEEWSFRRLEEHSNRVANYFLQKGYRRGDSVALYMDNRNDGCKLSFQV